MKKLFILLGAVITLLPIFLGQLRWWEYLIGGVLLSSIGAVGSIAIYNFVSNYKAEKASQMPKRTKYLERVLYSVAGSIIASVIAAICL